MVNLLSPASASHELSTAAVRAIPAGDNSRDALRKKVERAHQLFVSRTHDKVLRAIDIVSAVERREHLADSALLEELQTIAHNIAGNAGSFGYRQLSEIAYRLETAIDQCAPQSDLIFDLVLETASEFLKERMSRNS